MTYAMRKLMISIAFVVVPGAAAMAQTSNWTDCVKKYRSDWGERCSNCSVYKDSYVVYLKNICTEPIDVVVAVQEDTRKWRTVQFLGMAAGDSLRAYACIGTGKYLAWARRAGDTNVIFPTPDEVNEQYK